MFVPVGSTATLVGQAPGVGGFISILGYLFSLLGLLSCAVVYGLWTLQDWGRSLAYWLYLVSVPLGVIAIFPPLAGQTATAGNTVFQLVGVAIDLFIIVYLTKPQVKELFAGSTSSSFASLRTGRNLSKHRRVPRDAQPIIPPELTPKAAQGR